MLHNFFNGLASSGIIGILIFGCALDGANWGLAIVGAVVSALVFTAGYKAAEWTEDMT